MHKRKNLFQVLQQLVNKKRKKIESTQDTLNYEKMYPDGICYIGNNTYNRMIRFSDISYQLSKDEMKQKIFAQYSTLLNSIDETIDLQFSFVNFKMEELDNEEEVLAQNSGNSNFKKLRGEYLQFLSNQKEKGSNGIVRNKYLVFSVVDKTKKGATRRLETVQTTLKDCLKVMGSQTEELSGLDRLSLLNLILNKDSDQYVDLEDLTPAEMAGASTKDMISPRDIDFQKRTNSFDLGKGNRVGATLYFKIDATELSDRVLADFIDEELEQVISLHIRSLEHQKAIKMVKGKASDLDAIKIEQQKKAMQGGYDMDILPTDLNMNVKESKKILADLQRDNEKYFYMTFTITVFEKNYSALDDAIYSLQTIARKHNCSCIKMPLQQEKALQSALPTGTNINEKSLERGLTTTAAGIFVPFTTQELYQELNDPVYYGLNAVSKNMIQVSRKSLKNPNGLILGTPGSGKTFSAKREIVDVYYRTNDDILISDPENEYSHFVVLLGGKVVKLSVNSQDAINPLDISMDYGEGNNPVSFKVDFIMDMMELIAGGKEGLSPKMKTTVDKCGTKIYRPFIESPKPENIPILEDLYNDFRVVEKEENSVEAKNLADALELYVHGSLNAFNRRTSINLKNRLISFNINELGSTLKELGMLVLQDHVWNRVTSNKNSSKKSTHYYMDEFHKQLAEEQTSNYCVEFWKRFRKWGGIPTGITQNVKDLLLSPKIETILDNSDFIYLLNQASGDRKILQEKLEISDYQARYITNSDEGEGLLVYSGIILPFVDKFPKNNSLYPVMTSKPDEIRKMRRDLQSA